MRNAAITIAVVAVVLLVAPLLAGMRTEAIVSDRLAAMDENPMISLELESYDRGWFAGAARVGVGLDADYVEMLMEMGEEPGDPLLGAMIADMALTVILDIDHGPVIVNDGFYVGLSRFVARLNEESELVSEVQTRLAMPYLAELRGRIGLTGAFSYDADVPPIDYADETGEFSFSGAMVTGSIDDGVIVTNGGIDSIIFDVEAGTASISDIRISGENELVSDYISTGTMELAIARIIVTDAFGGAEPTFAASNLSISSEAELDDTGQFLNASLVYSADELSAGLGELDLANAVLGLQMTNLDVEVLDQYYDVVLFDPLANDDAVIEEAVAGLIMQALQNSPTLSIDPFRFEYFGEPFESTLELRVDADQVQGMDTTNLLALSTAFELTAELSASKTLADRVAADIIEMQLTAAQMGQQLPPGQDIETMAQAQAQLILATLLGQGIIVSEGDNYTTMIEYAGGELTVNGDPAPLGLFL